MLDLCILHNGFPGGKQTPGVGVAFTLRQLLAHIVDHFVRCLEAKGGRIADV